MAIYRNGEEVMVIGNCGRHKADYLPEPRALLVTRWADGIGHSFYSWDFVLRAGRGWEEIQAAMTSVPVFNLSPDELQTAMRQAE